MSGQRVLITPDGWKKLRDELHRLKTVERQEVIKLIEYARSLGDLSENAEYETAKQKQSFIEGRILEIEGRLGRAEVIDPEKITARDRVVFGLTVTVEDVDSGDIRKYKLVGEDESEPENGFISVTSPVGSALIGKRVDDEIQVRVPGGIKEFLVLSIE
ncbi:MAG: transcription elongation factor GreA [Candidatus Dadabacteria bacterium]|nr:transcription elongation factor GreA [Candidatus Dadabacteria bacterium]MXZ13073.1 transcription elongation factor GreA [Candidatus Dadabacteria bacterium]MYA48656.1 transcription elongation factor GreA [Candidatus Dadabacteria bacterium]MYC40473.1 transcription elongation factor GreA [Candidatus Dadabacteria bacterium]MYF47714.1 transcription elongation factor GreA [Candidatus Dadabacteria bacterium]